MKPYLIMAISLMSFEIAARSSYLTEFKKKYPTSETAKTKCLLCHESLSNLKKYNPYGQDYKSNGDLGEIENNDADADGFTNIVEIMAGTHPGNRDSFPSTTPNPPPTDPTDPVPPPEPPKPPEPPAPPTPPVPPVPPKPRPPQQPLPPKPPVPPGPVVLPDADCSDLIVFQKIYKCAYLSRFPGLCERKEIMKADGSRRQKTASEFRDLDEVIKIQVLDRLSNFCI